MMFLRYESFKEYIRFYPVNTILLLSIVIIHFVYIIYSSIFGVPVDDLKRKYGGFVVVRELDVSPEFWRYVTSVFLHADFGHLLFNAFAIFVFAPPLERALGKFRYVFLFVFSGICGNIFTGIFLDRVFSLGASGAVYGVFGAYLYYMVFRRRSMDESSRRTLQMLLIIGVLYSVIVPQINFYAHLGGCIGGFTLNLLYSKLLQGRNS
jgi:rhomboid protease GluP